MTNKQFLSILFAFSLIFSMNCILQVHAEQTICNPVNMSYRFGIEKDHFNREGADPTVLLYHNEYYAFVSKSGGYFRSADLIHWDLIVPNEVFPLETFAPTTVVIDDVIYLLASQVSQVIKTSDPKSGKWEVANPDFKIRLSDPALFLDDDGRLYYYAGCSNNQPIWGYELDPKTFEPLSEKVAMLANNKKLGWEEKSDYNTPNPKLSAHIEGAWMNKHNGKYYLQYANPGTEIKSYNDGVYVSDKPLGPYSLAVHNPFAYKPEGFVCGAGHGSTFQDKYGNWWHIGTVALSKRHIFERRLSLFPVFFDKDDEIYAYTGFGDYPMIVPDKKISSHEELFPNWMLLSYKKKVEVSSTLSSYRSTSTDFNPSPGNDERVPEVKNNDAKNINDEDIRSWWSAKTGSKDEWFTMDLGEVPDVYAVQINFADEGSTLSGRADNIYYQYTIEASTDNQNWTMLVDKSNNKIDAPHDYIQLDKPQKIRYFRVKNVYVPSGNFSVYDFRVFGKSFKKAPQTVNTLTVKRDADARSADLKWQPVPGAVGYNIRYGSRKNKLYHNYMVYDKNELSIHSLNAEQDYFFTVDTFNEGGITKGEKIVELKK